MPCHDNDSADHLQLAHSPLNDICPGSYHKRFLMIQGKLLSFLEMCDEGFIKYIFLSLGPMKRSSLILA